MIPGLIYENRFDHAICLCSGQRGAGGQKTIDKWVIEAVGRGNVAAERAITPFKKKKLRGGSSLESYEKPFCLRRKQFLRLPCGFFLNRFQPGLLNASGSNTSHISETLRPDRLPAFFQRPYP